MKSIVVLLLATALSFQCFSQREDVFREALINGRILTSDSLPVAMATVTISEGGNFRILQTSLADIEGRFRLTVYDWGNYLIGISAVGMDSLSVAVTVDTSTEIKLPDVVLRQTNELLRAVTVSGKRPMIRLEADRIIYDLEADPQSKVSSVLDMMRKVPYLSVDGNDNILLKGSSGYKVFINGRPSGMLESNPKDVLRSMPASTIKSIEVITSPPARYDAEGLAGIINIITIRQAYNGYRGSANVNVKGPAGGPGSGGSLTLKQGRFGMTVFAGVNQHKVPGTDKELRRTASGSDTVSLYQYATSQANSYTGYAGIELSYEPDSLNLISGQCHFNGDRSNGLSAQTTAMASRSLLQQYLLNNCNNRNGNGASATLNHQRGFKASKDRILTFSYRYREYGNSLFNDIVLSQKVNYPTADYRQRNSEKLVEHTAQVDYVQPIKNLTIEGGIKGIFRRNVSAFQYSSLNAITGEYETDMLRSNILNNGQNVLAVYNSYAYQSGEWQLKAGVRAEQTTVRIGNNQVPVQMQRRYLNILPVIVVSRKLKEHGSLSFSFSKRIQRPTIAELNPFVDRSNPDFHSSGNPYLQPITSDAYELSYFRSAKATVNISIGGLFFNNVFSPFPSYDSSTNITLTRYENYGKGRVFKTNIFWSCPVTDKWFLSLNSDIRHVFVSGRAGNTRVENSGFDFYIYASTSYRFNKGWTANADLTFRKGGILLPLGRTNGFIASSFSVSKGMISSRLTASAAVSNPFARYRYIDETIAGPGFLQSSRQQTIFRQFTVSLNYRFGELKEEIRKNRKEIINDDVTR